MPLLKNRKFEATEAHAAAATTATGAKRHIALLSLTRRSGHGE